MFAKASSRIIIVFFLIVLFALAGWWWWNNATSAFDPVDTSTTIFVVARGEGIRSIATRLKQQNLIRSPVGFFLKVRLKQADYQIQAGDFRLSPSMDVEALIEELTHGTLDTWVTTLEGWRVEEIAAELRKELGISDNDFVKLAKEGYMFPDTYLIPKEASAAATAAIMSNNFDVKVTADIRRGIENQGLTLDEGITLASIVEREGRTDSDRPVIAGILLKRLQHDWPLQADATLQYALGYQKDEQSWWKKSLFDNDKKIDSPYNTYLHKGLPPTPIANPGLAAIRAVAFPETSAYWYYLHDPQGGVHYAETLEEHLANVERYLR